jgi:hypothetical protein
VVQVDNDILLAITDDDEEASLFLLRCVSSDPRCSMVQRVGRLCTWAPFRINAGIRESLEMYEYWVR